MKEIFERRSIRKYINKPIPEEAVEQIIEAGMAAPSAGNEQPWEFIVIEDRKILEHITQVHPYARMINESPVVIVVCGNLSLQRYDGFWVQDCSAATQNMLIEATHLGVGSVWCGVYPLEERVKGLQDILLMPENVIPLAMIAFGYPIEKPSPVDRYKPERIHKNTWSVK